MKNPDVFIKKLMGIDASIDEIVEKGFNNDKDIQKIRDIYFEKII